MAGVTPLGVKVFLNEQRIRIKNFENYVSMYLKSLREENPTKIFEKINSRWEVRLFSFIFLKVY